jgi:hypothetical protein
MSRIKAGIRTSGSYPVHPVVLSNRLFLYAPIVSLLAVLCLTGCGPKNFVNENDKLREENLKLKQEVGELNEQMELRLGEIEALRAKSAGERAIKDADPPVLAKIEFGKYTGAFDTNDDGRDDLVRIYLTPLDHQGRMFPVAGRLKLQAVALKDDAPPALLATRTYEPAEFDDAYRANFTGYHYTLELKLPESLDPTITSATVKATFTEAVTGLVLSHEQIITIKAE